MSDAHVHMGYYTRIGYEEPFYYSPRRVVGLMDRCGIREFIVSSTNVQIECISADDIIREAVEMRRVAGRRAHQYLWLSGHLYDQDHALGMLDTGLFEGVKLHEMETPWYKERRCDLESIMEQVAIRKMKVQFHCSFIPGCRPLDLKYLAIGFPDVKFNFSHCSPAQEIFNVMQECQNIYTDTAMMSDCSVFQECSKGVMERIMFGSDFPAYHSFESEGFSKAYRKRVMLASQYGSTMDDAFQKFISSKS